MKYLAIVLGIFVLSCQGPMIQAPSGFAVYENNSSAYHLVSPDAVRVRVYKTENQPRGNLSTLTSAVELHFKSLGYEVLRNEAIETNNGLQGRLFITSVMTMNGEYRYLASFFPVEDDVLIVEAGGRKDDFAAYEKDLISQIRTLQ
ncbi:MAG TPA: hypothetical protein DEA96_18055 [Leptospiraceae bacterium]|nr:hypothetical protein [Spirochaetaceae bacterium]HBS06879.1 hypothetical protein [Leptospiraceae bacterium]|tara:strand:+ start:327 stop:764 length:438 start_codon:yes stop_codon:yes gene_type:complete